MTFKRFINWAVGLPIAIIGVGFAVANRQWVTVSFDPINRLQPFATIAMPLWALFFAGIFTGIFVGWFVAWRGAGKHRRSAREARAELIRAQQQHELEKRELRQSLPAARTQSVP
ncbi:LapA family protein [Aestuariivirga sp.]|uniref:LapA family protein n=1 Tax=Aestuariivirga sp. TaxID=2650926 RepID=UPI0025BFFEC9|nr:LapA family protein [Aestuariivirga sp.]MCA3556418.1 LapA family protein [Aestuariivirga sp.]